jgi:uncharacterized protein YyaL (SSP411 family)
MITQNRLAGQRSPYLRQHATNPVDWYPWCPEALTLARQLDRPIFLSIGYAACHWCHVMERECFENHQIAALLNEHFVPIKVDREERPDLDALYMNALHLLTREGGGWPLSVFLTPNLTPFYAGTYFPPDDRYAPHRPAFPRLLQAIIQAWRTRREEIEQLGQQVITALHQMQNPPEAPVLLTESILREGVRAFQRVFDPVYGGFGSAPKFPHAVELSLLLRLSVRFGEPELLTMVRQTLTAMALGGIHDQLGGGFARYSVDARWLVPHFEKMLYDNALLAKVYTEAALLTGDSFFADVARSTLDYVCRDLTNPAGLFCSSEDADSEGEEGKFYVWTLEEVMQLLGPELGEFACRVWGITDRGNFEGKNILYRQGSDADDARRLELSLEDFRRKLTEAQTRLFQVRQQRVRPARDDKIITAWNAWMITSLADAAVAWNKPDYLARARHAADQLLRYARDSQGRLLRLAQLPDDNAAPPPLGFLEDYSAVIEALITLYEACGQVSYLQTAAELARSMIRRFAEPQGSGFYFIAEDQEPLPARLKEQHDGATPSGCALAITALLRLSHLLQDIDLGRKAEEALRSYATLMQQQPLAAGQFLIALDWYLGPVDQVAVIGRRSDSATQHVLAIIRQAFRPRQVLAVHDPDEGPPSDLIPWLAGKVACQDTVTVYRCRDFQCQAPLIGPEMVEQAFRQDSRASS